MFSKIWNKIRLLGIIKAVSFQHSTKRITTFALAVWMSGIVLFVCCQMPSANAAGAEMENCPLAKKGDCGKTSEEVTGEFFGKESQSLDCCVFPAKVFDKVRKIEVQPSAIISEAFEVAAPKVFSVSATFQSPKFYQSFVRNRGSTHLNNCVFRI